MTRQKVTHYSKSSVSLRRLCVKEYGRRRNYYETGQILGIHRCQVRYWCHKYKDPTFHNKAIGGDTKSVIKNWELSIVNQEIFKYLQLNNTAREVQLRKHMENLLDRNIGYFALKRILKKLRWSWRVPTKFQIFKYTPTNLMYYLEYLIAIQDVPLQNLKFADEAHLVSKNLTNRRVLGLVNHRTYTKERTLHDPRASLSVMTSLDPKVPVIVDYREKSNTQWDFTDFVYFCCIEGYLAADDFLIVDNAAVHCAVDSYEVLEILQEIFQFKIMKLPCYSPELNPCELVFSKIKGGLRYHRGDQSLREEVMKNILLVTSQDIHNWYKHCLKPKVILPDFLL